MWTAGPRCAPRTAPTAAAAAHAGGGRFTTRGAPSSACRRVSAIAAAVPPAAGPMGSMGAATVVAAATPPCVGTRFGSGRGGRSAVVAGAAAKGFGDPKKKISGGKQLNEERPCPCGSREAYGVCCQRFHTGEAIASTPEQLLRSRYTAYYAKIPEYIADTTHKQSSEFSGTRSAYLTSVKQTQRRMDLQKLQIIKQDAGRVDTEHFITFKLEFYDTKAKGEMVERSEKSRFLLEDGKWYFIDSEFVE